MVSGRHPHGLEDLARRRRSGSPGLPGPSRRRGAPDQPRRHGVLSSSSLTDGFRARHGMTLGVEHPEYVCRGAECQLDRPLGVDARLGPPFHDIARAGWDPGRLPRRHGTDVLPREARLVPV